MAKKIQTGLGKGLGALISDIQSIQENSARQTRTENVSPLLATTEIPIDRIEPNPYQPRTQFDPEAIGELAQSIRLLGLIQPITVRPVAEGRYQIISGERRFRASRLAGRTTIPAYIRKTDDQGMLEMAIVENIQREDLDAIEVALSFRRLIEECNLTQEAMAERVGKKRATVTNYLRLLRLPAEIQVAIRAGKLSMGHAKSLLAVEDPRMQLKLAGRIVEQDLSVRQTETKIRQLLAGKKPRKEKEIPELPDTHFKVLEIVGKYFNNNVNIRRTEEGSGELVLRFSGDREIETFLEALEKSGL